MHESSPDLLVLHTVRCIGFATEDRIVGAAGLAPSDVRARLNRLLEQGLLSHDDGPFGGWGLTDEGRSTVERLVVEELEATGGRDRVHDCYQSFLQLNPTLLQVCGDWQMRKMASTHIVNDHTDHEYDAAVLTRLIRVDDAARQICSDLDSILTRFGWYGTRLDKALEKALGGQTEYVADGLDSYHTVWFRMHEDLLVTLGISRDKERSGR